MSICITAEIWRLRANVWVGAVITSAKAIICIIPVTYTSIFWWIITIAAALFEHNTVCNRASEITCFKFINDTFELLICVSIPVAAPFSFLCVVSVCVYKCAETSSLIVIRIVLTIATVNYALFWIITGHFLTITPILACCLIIYTIIVTVRRILINTAESQSAVIIAGTVITNKAWCNLSAIYITAIIYLQYFIIITYWTSRDIFYIYIFTCNIKTTRADNSRSILISITEIIVNKRTMAVIIKIRYWKTIFTIIFYSKSFTTTSCYSWVWTFSNKLYSCFIVAMTYIWSIYLWRKPFPRLEYSSALFLA